MNSKAEFYGFNPPFFGGPQNILSRQEDDQIIKNDILQFILTVPGERVMRPSFGVNLRNVVFDPGDIESMIDLQSDIREALLANDPRLSDVSVDITQNDDLNKMVVRVFARLRNDPTKVVTVEQFLNAGG